MTAKKQTKDAIDDYEVVEVNAGVRVGGLASVRLKPEEMDLLTALSEARRLTLSETLRLGLRCLSDQPETGAIAAGETGPRVGLLRAFPGERPIGSHGAEGQRGSPMGRPGACI